MRGDFLRLGLLVGAAVVLVGHFATRDGGSDNELFLFWLVLGLGISLLVAFALERAAKNAERGLGEEAAPRLPTGEIKLSVPTSSRFYAVSRMPSSAEMRALMVDAPAIPGNPISSRLQLIIERYDAYARLSLEPESLDAVSIMDVADRAREEAVAHLPTASADVTLQLVGVRSAGPLDDEGRCPDGWSFDFIDGSVGVQCTATVVATQMLLVYRTAVTYPRIPGEPPWVEPAQALAAAREARPDLREVPLGLRVDMPSEYYLLRADPLTLCEIDPVRGQVVMAGPPEEPAPEPSPDDGLTVDELVELLSAEATTSTALREELLACRRDSLRSEARRLFRRHGPEIVGELSQAALLFADSQPGAVRCLVNLLGHLPTDLAVLALVELSEALPTELEGIAFAVFDKRRHDELDVSSDPLARLDFEESRALLGKRDCQRIALRSTYDPEGDLLPGLEQLGLDTVRVRLLSGDTELFLSANLASSDRRTEALLSSSPLPVPCHVLRVLGPEAELYAQRVREAGLHYPDERIVEDILQGRPYDLHRGALYLAALRIDAPQAFDALCAAAKGNRTNLELRRAALAALGHLSHEGVDAFLAGIEDGDLLELARDLQVRRGKREPAGKPEPAQEPRATANAEDAERGSQEGVA